jgi:hypothetical protein
MPVGTVPPIVDEETFRIVRRQIAHNQNNASRNNKHPENALMRHLCRCGHCSGTMNVKNRNVPNVDKTKYWRYSDYFCVKGMEKYGLCPVDYNTITTSIVDDACWKFACDIIRDPEKLTAAIQALKTPNPVEEQEKPLAVQKKEIEEQIIEHMDMIHASKTEAGSKRAMGCVGYVWYAGYAGMKIIPLSFHMHLLGHFFQKIWPIRCSIHSITQPARPFAQRD